MASLVEVSAFIQTASEREVLDIQKQCLKRMEDLFGFAESPCRKRLRSEPGTMSRPGLVRREPLCFLKLQGEVMGKVLAMLYLKEAVFLRQCNSEMCSWWQPATPFMLGFLQCSPVGCLLRPYLAGHGSPSVVAAIQEICLWAGGSMLPFDTFVPVSNFSNGLTLEEAQRDHGEQVLMTAGKHTMSLSSRWCSAMAQLLMQGAVFARPDPVRTSIQSLAESISSVLEWPVCDFKTESSKLEVEDDDGGGGGYNHGEEFKVTMTTADGIVKLKLEISYFKFDDENVGDEESELSCTGTVHGEWMSFFRYRNSEHEHDQKVSGDLRVLNVLGLSLLGREVDPATLLHVLWRLLCAPMMVWPPWTPSLSCEFSRVAAEVETDEEPFCTPSLLRARNLFEIVASHVSVQEGDIMPQGVRELGLVSVSKSPFEEEIVLHQLSNTLACLATL